MLDDLDYSISKLLSGKTLCYIGDDIVYVSKPKQEDLLLIYDRCSKVWSECLDLLTKDEMLNFMLENEIWTLDEQKELDNLPDLIDNLKSDLYKAYTQFKYRDTIRQKLKNSRERLNKLYGKRHVYDDVTKDGHYNFIKSMYMVGFGVYTERGERYWTRDSFLTADFNVLESVTRQYTEKLLNDKQIRSLARSVQWRTYWQLNKNPRDIFQVNSLAELSDEQRALIWWSQQYDSIYSAGEDTPDDEVIEDDDLLDGWIKAQNKKSKRKQSDSSSTDGKRQDVFVIVENPDDLARVESLNSDQAKILKRKVIGQ